MAITFNHNDQVYVKDGKMGIGASDPLRDLHVVGNFAVNAGTDEYYGVYIPGNAEGSDPKIQIGDWHNASATITWDSSARALNIDTQYSSGAGTFNITGNDGASTFLTVNTSGNVGIGTTSPQTKLHVQGSAGIFNVSDDWQQSTYRTHLFRGGGFNSSISEESTAVKIFNGSSTEGKSVGNYWGGIGFMHLDPEFGSWGTTYTGEHFWIGGRLIDTPQQERSALVFATNNVTTAGSHSSEKMVILPNGNVGIGATSPSSMLEIRKATATHQLVSLNRPDSDVAAMYLGNDSSSPANGVIASNYSDLILGRDQSGTLTEHVRIKRDGNVGIGTTSPESYYSDKLVVNAGNEDGITIVGGTSDINYLMFADGTVGSARYRGMVWYNHNTDMMAFSTSGNNRVYIDATGNVGIGTTNPTTKLYVDAGESTFNRGNSDGAIARFRGKNAEKAVVGTVDSWFASNVGIGTTSPQRELHIKGDTWAEMRLEGRTFASGHGATLEFYSEGTALADIYASTDKHLYFRTNGSTERMRILANGNVGIGTTSPAFTSGSGLEIQRAGTATLRLDSGNLATELRAYTDGTFLGQLSASYLDLGTNNTSRVRIDSGGNVGIGTTNPAATLHISKGSNNSPTVFRIENVDTTIETAQEVNTIQFYTNDGSTSGTGITSKIVQVAENPGNQYGLSFYTYDLALAEALRITNDGNVGIGTTSPSEKLEVSSSGNVYAKVTTTTTGGSNAGIKFLSSGAREWGIFTDGNLRFYDFSGSSERMRIDTSGNVGIGTTSPASKLHVNGDVIRVVNSTWSGIESHNTNGSWESFVGTESGGGGNRYNSASSQHTFYNNSTAVMRINSSGNVGIGTTSPLTKLQVDGGVTINTGNGSSTFNDLNIGGVAGWSNSEAHRINFVYGNGTSDIFQTIESYYGGANEGKMRFRNFYTNNPQTGILMTIHSNGNVGIGTDSPDQNLQIHESTSSGAYLKVTNSATGEGGGNGSLFGISSNEEALVWNYENTATRFSTNGTERMRITAGGNLGIGLTDPAAKLEVLSSHHVRSAANVSHKLRIEARDTYFDDSDSAGIWISDGGSTGDFSGQGSHLIIEGRKNSSRHIYFKVGDTTSPQHIMKADGNVGIGTTSPTYKLDVNGGIRTSSVTGPGVLDLVAPTSFLRFQANANNIFYDAGGNHYFRTASGASTSMIVTSAGNVGIGTTSPSDKLTVAGVIKSIGGTNNGKFAQIYVNDSFAYYTTNASVIYMSSELQVNSGRIGSYDEDLSLETSGTTRITVSNSNGNVGIGTTAPQQALHIKGATNALMMLEGDNDNGIAGCYYKTEDTDDTMNRTKGFFGFTGNNIYGNGYFTMWLDNANDDGTVTASEERFRWERDGDFHADGDVIAYSTTTPSDIRLKTDVETIESASEKVSKLRGVEYTWSKGKLAGQREIGLIAQEVEAVVPEVVKEKELPLWDDSGESYKTVDYEKLVALLIESNKELQARVEQLENKLDGFTK